MKNRDKGIICIIGAAACFATMNLFIRLSGDLPVVQKGLFRNLVALIFSSIILTNQYRKNSDGLKINKSNIALLLMRSTFGMIGFLFNFYAVDRINISDASMLNKLSPFFAIVFSFIFIKEKAKWYQWLGVLLAIIGSMFIVKPSFSAEFIPAFIGFLGGLFAGMAYTCVRKMGMNGTKGPLIVFFFSLYSVVTLGPVTAFVYKPITFLQFIFLICTGLAACGGQFFVTNAYTYAPAKEISVYDYSQVIFAAILGFIFLGQIPDWLSVAGYVIIISVAVGMFIVNKNLDKKAIGNS